MTSMQELRVDFEQRTNRSMSLPMAGAIVWFIIAVVSFYMSFNRAIFLMLWASGAIFPFALLIAKYRKEEIILRSNPFGFLMGRCVLMVNLLWAIHIPLILKVPEFIPLTLGISLGLHWIVYSWIVKHPVGTIHSILRTVLVLTMWILFPEHRIAAVSFAIVVVYIISLLQMRFRNVITF